jgi:hypothetical protein
MREREQFLHMTVIRGIDMSFLILTYTNDLILSINIKRCKKIRLVFQKYFILSQLSTSSDFLFSSAERSTHSLTDS